MYVCKYMYVSVCARYISTLARGTYGVFRPACWYPPRLKGPGASAHDAFKKSADLQKGSAGGVGGRGSESRVLLAGLTCFSVVRALA